ncbi:hypothetical protein JOE29_000845 [Pseudomonas sp. PvP009]|nr:hypothetical protein [Pseudomonas sp. PvP009]
MLAKGSAQTPKMHRLKHRLREQARSHKISAAAEHLRGSKTSPTCVSNPHSSKTPRTCVSVSHGLKTPRPCGSELARERGCTSAENASTETPSSRASSLPQGHQCRRAFAWLETQPTCVSNPHSSKTPRTCVSVSHGPKTPRPCGSELARERGCTSAENALTETPSSRASSLPQGHQCRRAFAWLETQPTCVSNPHVLKTPRPCVSVSHVLKTPRPCVSVSHGLKTPRPCVSVSHGPKAPRPCGSELARERGCTSAENASTETPSSRASSLPQGHQCRRAFAWLETQPTCVSNPHSSKTPRPCVSVSHGPKAPRPCGSELARERGCTNAENASTETPPSRASSLPQGHQCRRAFAWLETQPTCVSNPYSSKTPRPCVSVSHVLKTPRPCVSVSHGPKAPRPCGSELARERVCTNAENASTETPPSRAVGSHKVISAAGHSHGSKHSRPV